MKDKQSKGKALIKNIALLFVASFIPKTLSFFLVPIYSHCLTTQEYGTIDLLTVTAQLLLPILTLQVQEAVLRFTLDKEQVPTRVFTAGFRIVIFGCGIVLCGTALLCGLGLLRMDWTYVLFFLVTFITGTLNNLFTYFLRAMDKVRIITLTSIVNCVITVGGNLLFLLVFQWGVKGYLLANSLGHICSIVLMFAAGKLYHYLSFRNKDKALIREIIAFSIPMAVSSLSWWVNHSLDKYILTLFWGVSAAGILAVAYKIPTIISTLGMIIARAFSVSVVEHFDEKDTDGFLGQSYSIISILMVLCASGLMIINVPLAKFLFAKDFFVAWELVPPLLISATMNLMSLSCEHVCLALKKTKVISNTALIGAGLNIALNFGLIPVLAGYGAAIATAMSFFVVWLLRYVWIKKHVVIRNCGIRDPLSYFLLIVQMFLAGAGNKFVLLQILLAVALLVMYSKELIGLLRKKRHKGQNQNADG